MNGKRTLTADRRRRRLVTLGWSSALLILVVLLIAFEKTAILYILATLGVSALLFLVAMADLGQADGGTGKTSSEKDAAIVASTSK